MHFGENMVILRDACKWVVAVTMTPRGLRCAHMGPYFDSWQFGGHKYALAGVFAGPLGVRVLAIPHLSAPGACPKNVHVFTKMHQSAQNTLKQPKMAKNRVKFVYTHFLDPPTLEKSSRSAILSPGI